MKEQPFYAQIEDLFYKIETCLETASDELDFETEEGVLTVILPTGQHIILSCQAHMKEVWMASPEGAYHFRQTATGWETAKGERLFQTLTQQLSKIGIQVQTDEFN